MPFAASSVPNLGAGSLNARYALRLWQLYARSAWSAAPLCTAGIEVVKCSAWEKPFLERIMQFRAKELATLWRLSAISAAQGFVIFCKICIWVPSSAVQLAS